MLISSCEAASKTDNRFYIAVCKGNSLPGVIVLSALPETEEVVSVNDNGPESRLVSEVVTDPGASPGLVLSVVVSDDLVSLALQLRDKSRDASNSLV